MPGLSGSFVRSWSRKAPLKNDAGFSWHYEANHGLKGTRIILRARRITKTALVEGSGSHRAQQTTGQENAEAWIEIPLRAVVEAKPKK